MFYLWDDLSHSESTCAHVIPTLCMHVCPGKGKTAAGPWGDYNCDVPHRTIINLFQYLESIQDQFDWIYWTGDITAHDVWAQTRNRTVRLFPPTPPVSLFLFFTSH